MKKYFMKDTQDEVQFGDILALDFTKDTKNGTIHKHLEVKFIPELVDMLLDEGVIVAKEACEPKAEPKQTVKGTSPEDKVSQLEKRVTELEGIVAELLDSLEEDE